MTMTQWKKKIEKMNLDEVAHQIDLLNRMTLSAKKIDKSNKAICRMCEKRYFELLGA